MYNDEPIDVVECGKIASEVYEDGGGIYPEDDSGMSINADCQ